MMTIERSEGWTALRDLAAALLVLMMIFGLMAFCLIKAGNAAEPIFQYHPGAPSIITGQGSNP